MASAGALTTGQYPVKEIPCGPGPSFLPQHCYGVLLRIHRANSFFQRLAGL